MAKAKEASEQNQDQQNQHTVQNQSQQQPSSRQPSQHSQAMQQRSGGGGNFGMQRRGSMNIPSLFAINPFQLMRMSPFQMMRLMTEEMDRMFDDFDPFFGNSMQGQEQQQSGGQFLQQAGGQTGGALQQNGGGLFGNRLISQPRVEVLEREGNLVVRADLPGMSPDDVNVELTDNGLLIHGERRAENTENTNGIYRSEVSYGSFQRLVPLPEGIKAEKAQAKFNNGVLEITLEAPQKQQNRRIEIQGGGAQQQQSQTQDRQSQSQQTASSAQTAGGEGQQSQAASQ